MYLLQMDPDAFGKGFRAAGGGSLPSGMGSIASAAIKKRELTQKLAADKDAAHWVEDFLEELWIPEMAEGGVAPNPLYLKEGSSEVFDFHKVGSLILEKSRTNPLPRASSLITAMDFLGAAFKIGPELVQMTAEAADAERKSSLRGDLKTLIEESKLMQSINGKRELMTAPESAIPDPTEVPPVQPTSTGPPQIGPSSATPIEETPKPTAGVEQPTPAPQASAASPATPPVTDVASPLADPTIADFRKRMMIAGALSSTILGETLDVPGMFPGTADQAFGDMAQRLIDNGYWTPEDAQKAFEAYQGAGASRNQTIIQTGDLTKPVITDTQKEIIKSVGKIGQLDWVIENMQPELLTQWAKLGMGWTDFRSQYLSKLPGGKLSPEQEAERSKQSNWLSQLDTIFVDKRKELTGVAFGPAELAQYYDIFPSTQSSPAELPGQLYALKAAEEANQARLLSFMETGKIDQATLAAARSADAEARKYVGALMDADPLTNYGFDPDAHRMQMGLSPTSRKSKAGQGVEPHVGATIDNIIDKVKKEASQ